MRRKLGEAFDYEEMKRIAAFARRHDIKLHLDWARLFLASAYTGVAPADYAALFDTVYVSLYKYFNAGTGAVLAGPRGVIEQVAHARKVFGGGLYQAWPYAAVALHFLDGFRERYEKAVATGKALFDHPGHAGSIRFVRFLPDARTVLAVGSDGGVCLWDAATGKRLHTFSLSDFAVGRADLSADGKTLVVYGSRDDDGFWDVATGAKKAPLPDVGGFTAQTVAFGRDAPR